MRRKKSANSTWILARKIFCQKSAHSDFFRRFFSVGRNTVQSGKNSMNTLRNFLWKNEKYGGKSEWQCIWLCLSLELKHFILSNFSYFSKLIPEEFSIEFSPKFLIWDWLVYWIGLFQLQSLPSPRSFFLCSFEAD